MRLLLGFVAGIIVALAGVIGFSYLRAPSEEEATKRYVLYQTDAEQKRLGIDCRTTDTAVKAFLQSEGVQTLVNTQLDLPAWRKAINPQLVQQTKKVTELVLHCGLLYDLGEKGRINGLGHLRLAMRETYTDLHAVDTILNYGSTERCDEPCQEKTRAEIREAITKVARRASAN